MLGKNQLLHVNLRRAIICNWLRVFAKGPSKVLDGFGFTKTFYGIKIWVIFYGIKNGYILMMIKITNWIKAFILMEVFCLRGRLLPRSAVSHFFFKIHKTWQMTYAKYTFYNIF